MPKGTCSVDGCVKPVHYRGLCGTHVSRLRRTGTVEARVRQLSCTADGCAKPPKRQGWCGMHWERLAKYGTLDLPPKKPAAPFQPCIVEGCGDLGRQRTPSMCNMHYYRVRRRGEVNPPQANPPQPYRHSAGYVVLPDKLHPMADKRGWIYEHRMVLFDAIGPGSHPCHHCGVTVTWGTSLETDHLDWNKANNDLTNLVPSCHSCNVRRTHRTQAAWARWLAHAG